MTTTVDIRNLALVDWTLFLVMEDDRPVKACLYEQDANQRIIRRRVISPNSAHEIVQLSGAEVSFAEIPVGAICKYEFKPNETRHQGVYMGNYAIRPFDDTFSLEDAHGVYGGGSI